MQFAHPEYLWGFLSILVPIAIHLFHFRRYRTLFFSDIRNIQNIERETRRQRKLKHYLILASRILFLSFLTLAFARPFYGKEDVDQSDSKPVYLFVDNGPFSDQDNGRGSMLLQMKSMAGKIIGSYPSTQRFQVFSRDMSLPTFEGLGQGEALEYIAQLEPGYQEFNVHSFSERLKRAGVQTDLFLLSPFLSISESEWIQETDSNLHIHTFPIQSPRSIVNLSVDSTWFDIPVIRPGLQQEIKVRVQYSGRELPDSMRMGVRYFENDTLKGLTSVTLYEEGSKTLTIRTTLGSSGWKRSRIEFMEEDRVLAESYFGYSIKKGSTTLALHDPPLPDRLKQILDDDYNRLISNKLDQVSTVDIRRSSQVILYEPEAIMSGLSTSLRQAVESGQTLLFIPSNDHIVTNQILQDLGVNATMFTDTQRIRIAKVHDSDPFWSGSFRRKAEKVDLPAISTYYRVAGSNPGLPLFSFVDGAPGAIRITRGSGQIILCMFSFSANPEFLEHNVSIPFLYQGNFLSRSEAVKSTTAGSTKPVFFPMDSNDESAIHLEFEGDRTMIPSQNITETGVYIKAEHGEIETGIHSVFNGSQLLGYLGVNKAPVEITPYMESPPEFDPRFYKRSDSEPDSIVATLQKEKEGDGLWKLCIIFAVLFLLSESLISRFLK